MKMELDVVPAPERVPPLLFHPRRQLWFVLTQPEVLADLGHQRHLGALQLTCLEPAPRRREDVWLPVDPATPRDRLPRLVVDRQRDKEASFPTDERSMTALQKAFLFDGEVALNKTTQLVRLEILPSRAPCRDESHAFGRQSFGNRAQRS